MANCLTEFSRVWAYNPFFDEELRRGEAYSCGATGDDRHLSL